MDEFDDCINTHLHMLEQHRQVERFEELISNCANKIKEHSEYLGKNQSLDIVEYIEVLAAITGLRTQQNMFIQAIKEVRAEDSES
jgi:hypothetical protein